MKEESSTAGVEKVRRYACPGCGADLVFEPVGGCLVCPYCGRREQIEVKYGEVGERDFEEHLEYLRARPERLSSVAAGALEVKCDRCGATVIFTPPEVAGECDFCGGKIVAQPRSADPLIAPEGVLPFGVNAEQAADAVRRWVGGLWFAPNALKRLASHQPVGGVYIPFWTYDAHASTSYTGQRGEYYYETQHYTTTDAQGRQQTHTRQVRHTRWHPAEGMVARWFDDILIPATKSLPPARLHALEPWDLPALRAYEPAYLSGYKAQRYQVDLPEGFGLAKQLSAPVIERDVRADIGGDEQQIDGLSTHYSAITFKHLLLPVYVGAYHFNQKIYQVVVNGRTGEVQGERPYSVWKILLLVLFILIALGVVVLLFGGSES
jgi:DNA-directed RNA polymerase subunit RPC12/RpoP